MLFTMVFFAGEGEAGELENARLLRDLLAERPDGVALKIWNDLLLPNDPDAPAVIDAVDGPPQSSLSALTPSAAQIDLARDPTVPLAAKAESDELARVREVLATLPVPKIGSYGLAATGVRTASGSGLLFGSPQAGFLAPAIFYELGLHGPGIDCEGFTVPGLGPHIGIGWCNGHAWTLVAGNAGDQVDTYVETLNPDNPRQYRFDGEWRDMDSRTEVYLVKSTVPPNPPQVVVDEVLSTVHGPVFFKDEDRGIAYTHRRSQRGHFAQTFLGSHALNFGHSIDEVLAGARQITATYNALYADEEGNIAYRFTGWQPVRDADIDLRLPTPGTGGDEWASPHLPFDAMPGVVNPARGMLNVNQGIDSKPIAWWPRSSDIFAGRVGHVEADRRTFASENGLDIARMKALNRRLISDEDTVTPRLASLIEDALSHQPAGTDLGRAWTLFADWRARGYPRVDGDGDGKLDHPAITLFGADYLNFPRSPVWDRFMDEVWVPIAGRHPRGSFVGRLGQTIAAVESPALFSRPYGAASREKFRAASSAAIADLRERFGGAPMEQWLSDAPTTPFIAIGIFAPPSMKVVDHGTYSQIVDLGRGEGVNILPPGNGRADRALDVLRNGAEGSFPAHFADQIALYEAFEFKTMRMSPADFTADAESVEVLLPPPR